MKILRHATVKAYHTHCREQNKPPQTCRLTVSGDDDSAGGEGSMIKDMLGVLLWLGVSRWLPERVCCWLDVYLPLGDIDMRYRLTWRSSRSSQLRQARGE